MLDQTQLGEPSERAKENHPDRHLKQAGANWFSDLAFTRKGLFVKKTGRRIGLNEITPFEFANFLLYFGYAILTGLWVRVAQPSKLSIYFTPDRPRPWFILWSALTLSGIKIANEPSAADAAFYFEDTTHGQPPSIPGMALLNGLCTDISKTTVAEIFGRVAGYELAIDPTTYQGVAVEKGEANGIHDGRKIECPVPREPGKSYQLFIDSAKGDIAYDFRTTIIDRKPRFVLVKTKPAEHRFSIHNDTVTFKLLDTVFSADEIALITRFAEQMCLDWAALDVLRDIRTNRIYIVDVNKTDTGPAADLSWRDRLALSKEISVGLKQMVTARARRAT